MLASFLVRSGKETQRQFFGYAFVRLDEELWRHLKDDREATAEKSVCAPEFGANCLQQLAHQGIGWRKDLTGKR